jgi:NADH-quinone oxidoreductase subunit C
MPDRSAAVPGLAGGETRLQVLASVAHPGTDLRVILKADVPDDDPRIASWTHVYSGAAWHEREAWEMFGITFEGNPDLRHLYLPTGFEGHPLRKEFPLLARVVKPWPGIVDVEPMPGGEDDEESEEGVADG